MTAAGRSLATDTGRKPRSLTATRRPMPPTTSTAAAGGSRSASRRAPAWADVTTSDALVGTPRLVSCAAMADGVREALLVTNATRRPAAFALAGASAAPATGDVPV